MPESVRDQIDKLHTSIAGLEAQRGILGDQVVGPALAALREQLAALEADLALEATSRAAPLDGERRLVTILFTDIVGSTSIAERLDPEEWKEIVSDAHRIVSRAVDKYQGTVAQLLGDGVLAFFGAPVTHEDDPVRAVRAALDIQSAIADWARTLAGYVDNFQMRVGINTGTVVVGKVGGDLRMEYLAIGDSVNLAARLQSAAAPGKVLISESTARLVRSSIELESLGEIAVKGKAEPVPAYQVVEAKAGAGRGRGVEGLISPLVGRESDLALLREALSRLVEGQGQIVAVIGEAGIGKSRLVEEIRHGSFDSVPNSGTLPQNARDRLLRMAPERSPGHGEPAGRRPEGSGHPERNTTLGGVQSKDAASSHLRVSASEPRWLEARSLSYGQSLPFWGITQLLKADLGLADGDPEPKMRANLRRRLTALFGLSTSLTPGSPGAQILPYLAHLLGITLEGESAERLRGLDGETLKRQTMLSISDYVARLAQEQPTVLVFEDLHWADPSTLELLDLLFALTDRVPAMLLLVFRPERDRGAWRLKLKAETEFAHRYTEINLQPLSLEDSNELVDNLLDVADLPGPIRKIILARSEGVPFYLEEIIRSLIEQGAIVHAGDGWHATTEMANVSIPETLQELLLARIDRLEEDTRRTLQLASVIGRSFLYRLLQAVAEADKRLDENLARLQRVDLVREKTRRPELEYIFKHSLTHEAAYHSLLLERRKEFHRRVGGALEQLFADRKEEFYGLLAHHFDLGGEHDKAVDYLILAGDEARHEDASEEATGYYRRAVELLTQVGEEARAARTWLKLGLVYHSNFQFDAAHQANEAAFALQRKARGVSRDIPAAAGQHGQGSEKIVLRYFAPYAVARVDPGLANWGSELMFASTLFAGLAEWDEESNVLPHVARSWEVLDRGTRYLIHLRDDVRWTDGTSVTSGDFEWAWKRNLAPGTASPTAPLLDPVAGARDYREGRSVDPNTIGVRAIDALTLEVLLSSPVAYFPYLLAQPVTFPLHRASLERYGTEWWKPEHIVSNGPFRLLELDLGKGAVFERNPGYFGEFRGNVERVELFNRHDETRVLREFLEGKTDVAVFAAAQREPLAGLNAVPPSERTHLSMIRTVFMLLSPLHPPLDDLRVRRALIQALDRSRFSETAWGPQTPPARGGLVPPGLPGHSPELGPGYDLEAARRLLAEAGYPKGKGFPRLGGTVAPVFHMYAEELARQWREGLGVELSYRVFGPGQEPAGIDAHFLMWGWVADYPDPDNFLRQSIAYSLLCGSGWRDERYDELVAEAARTPDRKRRMAMYREADRIWVQEQALVVPLLYDSDWIGLFKPWVKGPSISQMHAPFKDFTIESGRSAGVG